MSHQAQLIFALCNQCARAHNAKANRWRVFSLWSREVHPRNMWSNLPQQPSSDHQQQKNDSMDIDEPADDDGMDHNESHEDEDNQSGQDVVMQLTTIHVVSQTTSCASFHRDFGALMPFQLHNVCCPHPAGSGCCMSLIPVVKGHSWTREPRPWLDQCYNPGSSRLISGTPELLWEMEY